MPFTDIYTAFHLGVINTGLSHRMGPVTAATPIPQGSRSGSEFGSSSFGLLPHEDGWLLLQPFWFPAVGLAGASQKSILTLGLSTRSFLTLQVGPLPQPQAPPTKLETEESRGAASIPNQSLKDATSNYAGLQCALRPFVVNGSQ